MMSWATPGWNWGYADGTAHDAAMRVRSALATRASRQSFLDAAAAGSADLETVKMALALKCQRARNHGYDSADGRWEELMEDMAACAFEGEGGADKLAAAIAKRLAAGGPPSPGAGPAAALALAHLGFVKKGL